MKKILLFTSSTSGGGAEKQLIKIHELLLGVYECIFFVAKKNHDTSNIKSFNKKRTSFAFFNLLKEIYKFSPDVLISTLPTPNFLNVLIKRIFNFKYMSVVRIAHYNLNLKSTRFIIRNADIVIFNSHENLKLYKEKFETESYKFNYLNNIVETFNLSKNDQISNKNIKRGIVASSLHKRKGIDLLIKAMNEIDNQSITIDVYGIGSEYNKLEKISNNPNLRILNKVTDLKEIWINYDFFLLPSRSEGLSNSLLEAQANNLFSIVSDCLTGNVEIIDLTKNGVTFENGNYKDLKLKILNYLESKYISSKSGDLIYHNFSRKNALNKLQDLFG